MRSLGQLGSACLPDPTYYAEPEADDRESDYRAVLVDADPDYYFVGIYFVRHDGELILACDDFDCTDENRDEVKARATKFAWHLAYDEGQIDVEVKP